MAVAVHQEVVREDVRLRVGVASGRALLVLAAAAAVFGVAVFAGLRFALLLLIGVGFGATLEGLRFGFAGPWRSVIHAGDARGLVAQLLAIGLTAVVALPLLATHPGELAGAQAPIGTAMVLGAFVFGFCMQIVLGCGSGTVVNAGSGNAIGLLALPLMALGSFLATLDLERWLELGSLPVVTLQGELGTTGAVLTTVAGLGLVGVLATWRAQAPSWVPPRRLLVAACLLAALALANLVVAGQPWGVVYGLGLWGAKIASAAGFDPGGSLFWQLPGNAERLRASILTDFTSLTNLGLVAGAFIAARWNGPMAAQVNPLPLRAWAGAAVAALVMGYASRIAYGCNVGAFFSGIATGSLHGWAWFAAAFLGSMLGVRARPALGLR
jgi:hypothetical protein